MVCLLPLYGCLTPLLNDYFDNWPYSQAPVILHVEMCQTPLPCTWHILSFEAPDESRLLLTSDDFIHYQLYLNLLSISSSSDTNGMGSYNDRELLMGDTSLLCMPLWSRNTSLYYLQYCKMESGKTWCTSLSGCQVERWMAVDRGVAVDTLPAIRLWWFEFHC